MHNRSMFKARVPKASGSYGTQIFPIALTILGTVAVLGFALHDHMVPFAQWLGVRP